MKLSKVSMALIAVLVSLSVSSSARKNNISIGEARIEVGVVAALQGFPEDYRLDRAGSLEVENQYYHVFITELPKSRRWRTLVFANSGDYLGYYQTFDPPVEVDAAELIFPGPSDSAEFGSYEEGEFDSGNAHVIRFGEGGPPDEVKFEDRTYSFISSPKRVRPDDPAYRFSLVANRVADAINQGRYKTVRDDFSPSARRRISEEQTVAILSGVRDKLGRVEKVGAPWIQSADTAVLPVTFKRAVAGLKLTLSDDEEIVGLWVLPFQTAFPEVGPNNTRLALPFSGRWRALWGGGARGKSKYFGDRVSHDSLEFVISDRFGKTRRGEGKKNKDYFAFGQPVLAPAAGVVIAVVNGVKDNRPHSPNPFDRLGNTIMIQHTTNEFSVVGHLMNHSLKVEVGEVVMDRQLIGLCGNSGDSSQPSVYLHVQDSPRLLAGSGYRPLFSDIYVWRGSKADIAETYSPIRGEFVLQRLSPDETSATR